MSVALLGRDKLAHLLLKGAGNLRLGSGSAMDIFHYINAE
jgi:hypothetical protein